MILVVSVKSKFIPPRYLHSNFPDRCVFSDILDFVNGKIDTPKQIQKSKLVPQLHICSPKDYICILYIYIQGYSINCMFCAFHPSPYLSISICCSLYLSIYLSFYLCINVSIILSIYLHIYLFQNLYLCFPPPKSIY